MYLFVWPDGRARQLRDNLTVVDCLAVKQGLLFIFRVNFTGKTITRLTFVSGRASWVKVPASDTASGAGGRIHY